MRYLLDSDIVIELLENDPVILEELAQLAEQGFAISMVTYMEIYQGVLLADDVAQANVKLETLLMTIPVLPFSTEVARRCAHVRIHLQERGRRIRPRALDLMNAATAIEIGLTLITRNRKDYSDIAGLDIYPVTLRRD